MRAYKQMRHGLAVPAVLGIMVAIAALVGIGYYASRNGAGGAGAGGGAAVRPDGTILEPDGTIMRPDGTVIKPDGTIIIPAETAVPSGTGSSGGRTPGTMQGYSGEVLAGAKALLLAFNKADYDKAAASGKIVFLYFYANWCPICKEEIKSLYKAFNELDTDRVVGFRVNYNDNETDSNEKALASRFGVAYQHTKVAEKDGKRVLKAPETWNKAKYLSEIERLLAA